MIRKRIAGGMALLLGVSLLSGCQETPVEVLVTPKEQKGNVYEEEGSAAETSIKEKLGIQDTYSFSLESADQLISFTAENVEVEYPDVNDIPVYEVSVQRLDQDFVDQVTNALFGEAPVYFELDYKTHTKSEIIKEIEFMKESVAKGNLNPYDYGGKDTFDIYAYIEELEERYAQAPKEYTHKAVTPSIDFDPKANGYQIPKASEQTYQDAFSGYAVVDEDHVYSYDLCDYGDIKKGERDTEGDRSIKAVRDRSRGMEYMNQVWQSCDIELLENPEDEWVNYYMKQYDVKEGDLEKEAGISLEEAEKQADALVEKLGMEGLERSYWNPALLTTGSSDGYEDLGYEFHYTRNVNGVSTLYTRDNCAYSSSIDSTEKVLMYEAVTIIISEDGMESVEVTNPYKIGNIRQENPLFLSFNEIIKKFEDMLLVQNAKMSVGENENYHQYFQVEKVVLSYMRITEAETEQYLLVPVWDFLGRQWNNEYSVTYLGKDGEICKACTNDKYPWSMITINALDGTIVDRVHGY